METMLEALARANAHIDRGEMIHAICMVHTASFLGCPPEIVARVLTIPRCQALMLFMAHNEPQESHARQN